MQRCNVVTIQRRVPFRVLSRFSRAQLPNLRLLQLRRFLRAALSGWPIVPRESVQNSEQHRYQDEIIHKYQYSFPFRSPRCASLARDIGEHLLLLPTAAEGLDELHSGDQALAGEQGPSALG